MIVGMSSYQQYGSYGNEKASSPGQVLSGLGVVALIFIVALVGEVLYKSIYDAKLRYQTLIDYTAASEDGSLTIHQDESKYSDAKQIKFSVNERTGIEFSYSFYIYVNSSTIQSTENGGSADKWFHVFHKGYETLWPLIGPGVFISSTSVDGNTRMRVVMNTYKNPFTYADIKGFPLNKWFHVVLNCYNNGIDIFINGDLKNRVEFSDTLPYQNFQDLILFYKGGPITLNGTSGPSVLGSGNNMVLTNGFNGKISNLIYTRYALSVTEIQNIMQKGVSSQISAKVVDSIANLSYEWTGR
jgi:hypothetical protein